MSKQDERRRLVRDRHLREARMKVARVIADGGCLLCGNQAKVLGIWETTPEVAQQLGAAPGKIKLFAYMMCPACIQIPDPSTMIEDKIMARWQRDTAGVSRN
jgi:hypothetical protein